MNSSTFLLAPKLTRSTVLLMHCALSLAVCGKCMSEKLSSKALSDSEVFSLFALARPQGCD